MSKDHKRTPESKATASNATDQWEARHAHATSTSVSEYEYLAVGSGYRRTGDSEEWAEVWRIRGYDTFRRTKAVAAGEWESLERSE